MKKWKGYQISKKDTVRLSKDTKCVFWTFKPNRFLNIFLREGIYGSIKVH